ncbi:MAG: hypothetical protein ACKVP0_04490 [Pirellulaceae bacterium]
MQFDKEPILSGIARLKQKGIAFDQGLSDREVGALERRFTLVFPPDLRFFLQSGLPVSPYFVNWRGESDQLAERFERVVEGVLFDVENNVFWHSAWGTRPKERPEALAMAQRNLADVPKLIPIGDLLFTKCIPATPNEPGNPVFSINQTDVLHAGRDLGDFLHWFSRPKEEFERDEESGNSPTPVFSEDYRHIEFWTDVARQNASM